jgi:hypothetical protein
MFSMVTVASHFCREATKASSNAPMLCTGHSGELREVLGLTTAAHMVGGWIVGQ